MARSQRVYIGNIPLDAEKRDLEKFFKGYGRLLDTKVLYYLHISTHLIVISF